VRLRQVSLTRISRLTIVITLLLMLASAATSAAQTWSVAAGGVVMLVNFHLLRWLVSLLIRPASASTARAWAIGLLSLKLALGVGVVAAVFYKFPVEPLAFAAGASTLLVAAVLEAAWIGEPLVVPADEDPERRRN
jgi:hypothetical protein